MREFLGIDAGGTSSRAVLVDAEGRCRGYGRAAGGNPTSRGAGPAAAAVASAIEQALAASGGSGGAVEVVLLAHAGGHEDYLPGIEGRIAPLGVRVPVRPAGDLLALFASGTHETEGAALIAGTGAIGGVIRDGRLARVVDGTGWLLGDAGSGFAVGHRVARAVVDDLDGGPTTRLTPALLEAVGLEDDGDRVPVEGRPPVMNRLVHVLYELPPVQLSGFAPLAFALADEDPVARGIVQDAVAALAALLARVRGHQSHGPLVVGGSVLIEGVLRADPALAAPLLDAAGGASPVPVADGLVGAAVLALRAGGVEVDADRFARLASGVRAAAAAWSPRV
ncbi:BadF/BadG/BcrA/BcrD ATPase family protein [Amnibacterium soli]|uniref:BadF/BadG/BcrA/BcrD ATPase family protein n=1 Tax=Amnibacterium soli TaxID=1282736 RepID=A0ABP8YYZ9_9MICO